MSPPSCANSASGLEGYFTNGIISDAAFSTGSGGNYDDVNGKFLPGKAAAYVDSRSSYLTPVAQIIGSNVEPGRTLTLNEVATMKTNYDNDMRNIRAEYTFYRNNYECALNKFFTSFEPGNTMPETDKTAYLNAAMKLNRRINALFEISDILTSRYMRYAEMKVQANNGLNQGIREESSRLQAQYDILNGDSATILNQSAMVRFTEEKNNYVTNQISLMAALNIVALGAIFYVYRQM